jgi:hypothetical protein
MCLLGVTIAATSLLAGSVAAASAADPPPKIEAFLKLCEASRRGAILQLEHRLRGLQAEGAQTPQVARQIAKVEEDLRVLRANKEPVVPPLRFPPEVGAIGRLPRLTCHVDQILTEREMLVRCFFSLKVTTVQHFRSQGETVVRPVEFLVRGLPTGQTHEGTDLQLIDVFEITGTKTYQTTDGRSKTIWIMSPFDMRVIAPYFKAGTAVAR